jgi:HAD superfamily hydrolase (TIGR01662 family)
MLKAIIFDIDGVLADSFEANLKFTNDILKYGNFPKLKRSDYKKQFHLSLHKILQKHTKLPKAQFENFFNKTYKHIEYPFNLLKKPLHSDKVIYKLSKKYKLAIVTSRFEKGVERYFTFSKLEHLFKVIVHHSHFKNPKPHPEPLQVALKRLKIKPTEAVYIGDSLTDLQAAKAAKMKSILFSKKNIKGADFKINKFNDLLKLIKKI